MFIVGKVLRKEMNTHIVLQFILMSQNIIAGLDVHLLQIIYISNKGHHVTHLFLLPKLQQMF